MVEQARVQNGIASGDLILDEIMKGRRILLELKERVGDEDSVLVEEVMRSLNGVVALLIDEKKEDHKTPKGATKNNGTMRRKQQFGEKITLGAKRRRTTSTCPWTRVTSTVIEDGFSWRKYGDKGIQNAKHRRSYYRCTNKHDQDCEATKHVQRSESDPTSYNITYIGKHTCKQNPSFGSRQPLVINFESPDQDLTNLGTNLDQKTIVSTPTTVGSQSDGVISEHDDVTTVFDGDVLSMKMNLGFMDDTFEDLSTLDDNVFFPI